jgi:hypothetical protein
MQLSQNINYRKAKETMCDSLIINLWDHKNKGNDVYYYARNLTRPQYFSPNDRTLQQLKNSGALRLIRKIRVSDSIMSYDQHLRYLMTLSEDERGIRDNFRDLVGSVFDGKTLYSQIDTADFANYNRPAGHPVLFMQDPASINKVISSAQYLKTVVRGVRVRQERLKASAADLLTFLQKEYHLHPGLHRGSKKWTHYFWEFFMLFLAVTLGFFVENKREHYIEHKREKEYVKQLVQDLKTDTTFFLVSISANTSNQVRMDSLILLLQQHVQGQRTEDMYYLARNITSRGISTQYSNRTFEQLKNSGSLRLIRNTIVLDSVTLYYESLKDLDIRLQHRLQRLHNLFLANEELFDGWTLTGIADSGLKKISHTPPLITNDMATRSRYITRLGYYKSADEAIIERILEIFLPSAVRLIALLTKEYHLK